MMGNWNRLTMVSLEVDRFLERLMVRKLSVTQNMITFTMNGMMSTTKTTSSFGLGMGHRRKF